MTHATTQNHALAIIDIDSDNSKITFKKIHFRFLLYELKIKSSISTQNTKTKCEGQLKIKKCNKTSINKYYLKTNQLYIQE